MRYALVDLTACSGPYENASGTCCIDLLEHPAYPIPQTSLKSRPIAADQPAPEGAPAASLDYVEIKDKEEEERTAQHPPHFARSETWKIDAPPSRSEQHSKPPHAGVRSDEDAQALLAEGTCLLKELRKSPGWEEADGEAAPRLDTLLRVKRYPLDWLIDEAIAYSSYRTKTGTHSLAGFLQWCNPVQNPIAGKRLASYRTQQATAGLRPPSMATPYRSSSYLQHASQTEADRAALAAARASRTAYLAEPHEKPDYLR